MDKLFEEHDRFKDSIEQVNQRVADVVVRLKDLATNLGHAPMDRTVTATPLPAGSGRATPAVSASPRASLSAEQVRPQVSSRVVHELTKSPKAAAAPAALPPLQSSPEAPEPHRPAPQLGALASDSLEVPPPDGPPPAVDSDEEDPPPAPSSEASTPR